MAKTVRKTIWPFFAISEPAWIADFMQNGLEADLHIFRDFEPQLYTVWNFGRGLTQAEAGERLGVSRQAVQLNANNGHLSDFGNLLGPDWNEKGVEADPAGVDISRGWHSLRC